MSLTEAEVAAIETDVQAEPLDREVELAWARETRPGFVAAKQKLQAEFKMWKFTRNDARMQTTAKELEHVRACLAYLDGVLGESL